MTQSSAPLAQRRPHQLQLLITLGAQRAVLLQKLEQPGLGDLPRAPHGLTDTHKTQLNEELLAFVAS